MDPISVLRRGRTFLYRINADVTLFRWLILIWKVKTEDCVPYLSGEGHTQKCTKSTCFNNGYNPTIYKVRVV